MWYYSPTEELPEDVSDNQVEIAAIGTDPLAAPGEDPEIPAPAAPGPGSEYWLP